MTEKHAEAVTPPFERPVRQDFLAAMKDYWQAAYAEGAERREHDTEDGAAQKASMALLAAYCGPATAVELLQRLCSEAEKDGWQHISIAQLRAIVGPNVEVSRRDEY